MDMNKIKYATHQSPSKMRSPRKAELIGSELVLRSETNDNSFYDNLQSL